MKALKVLNKINEAVLFLYIPFVLTNFENIFHNGDKDGVVLLLCITVFFTTFICGGIIIIYGFKRGVENSYSFSDLKMINKVELLLVSAAYAGSMIIFAVNYRGEFLLFYLFANTISLVFVFGENIVIQKADVSPYYKIHLPIIIWLLPVALFIPKEMFVLNRVPEKYETAAGLGIFALCGIAMAYCAWHGYFVVNAQLGTVEKNRGILQLFKGGENAIVFNDINYIEEGGLYYALVSGDKRLKINKLFSNAGKLKRTLSERGIEIRR